MSLIEEDITYLLIEWGKGNKEALDKLVPLVYKELRKLASIHLSSEHKQHSLQPTALVNEAFIRLVDWHNLSWQNRTHFFAVASQLMRNILVDHARTHLAIKRGAGQGNISLAEITHLPVAETVDIVALDEALTKLADFDLKQSKIVELRYFGGLTIEETAAVLALSPATIKREWNIARAWLLRELSSKG